MTYFRVPFLVAALAVATRADQCTIGSDGVDTCDSAAAASVSLLQTELSVKSAKARLEGVEEHSGAMQVLDTVVQLDKLDTQPCPDKAPDPLYSGPPAPQGHCMPQCKYSCEDTVCDQECKPECLKAECQTRCPDMSTTTLEKAFGKDCKFSCKKPKCEVQCPKTGCGNNDCPGCKTVCHTPDCTLNCAPACHEVCKQPKCNWKCEEPKKCPKPKCNMHCEAPHGCMKIGVDLPALEDGMVVVDSFEAGADAKAAGGDDAKAAGGDKKAAAAPAKKALLLLQQEKTMTVAVKRAVKVPGSSELQLVEEKLTLPYE